MVDRNLHVVYFELTDYFIWLVLQVTDGVLLGLANVYIPPDSSKYVKSFEPVVE